MRKPGAGIYGHVSHIGPPYIDNASHGVITGNVGVSLAAQGSVVSRGTISGAAQGVVFSATQSLTNEGTISSILMAGDGFITNTKYDGATGTITAITFATAGTLENAGLVGSVVFETPGLGNRVIISAGGPENTATFGAGINLNGGVLEYNEFVDAISNEFTGYSEVLLSGGAVYVTSALTIAATAAVESLDNARLVAAPGGSLIILGTATAGTVINTGTIMSAQVGIGDFAGLATVSGAAYITQSGTIDAPRGIDLEIKSSVWNTGVILSGGLLGGSGIMLQDGGYARNSGLLDGFTSYDGTAATLNNTGTILFGADLQTGGDVSNAAAGVILGSFAVSDGVGGGAAMIANAGYIGAGSFTVSPFGTSLATTAIQLNGGGTVINTGTIEADSAGTGIAVREGGTVVDSGTIGGGAVAVSFATGFTSRLVLDPGAALRGQINLGGGVLELAAQTGAEGVFSPTQTPLTGAGTILLDPGATWEIAGAATLGAAVVNAGTITEAATDQLTIAGSLSGTGLINLGLGVALDGKVTGGQTLAFLAGGETLALGDATGFAGKIDNFGAGDLIDLSNVAYASVTSSLFSRGVLTISEAGKQISLTFADASTFGTLTPKVFADGPGVAITLSGPI